MEGELNYEHEDYMQIWFASRIGRLQHEKWLLSYEEYQIV